MYLAAAERTDLSITLISEILTPSVPEKGFFEHFNRFTAPVQEGVTKLFLIPMKSFPISKPQSTKSRFASPTNSSRFNLLSRHANSTTLSSFYYFICDTKPSSYTKEQFSIAKRALRARLYKKVLFFLLLGQT